MPRVLTDNALALLDDLPPWFQDDPNVQAAISVMSNEVDRCEAMIEEVINMFWPFLAEQFLYLWEAALGISVNPAGQNIAQRQARAAAFYLQRVNRTYGSSWVQAVTALLGPGWSWERAGDSGTPAHTIRITLPYQANSAQSNDLITLLDMLTPANTVIEVIYGHGFIIQQSGIQVEPL